ncbi:MAG: alpha/beta hydrolase family protein, partial [Bdellovibrionales bacterium]
DGKIQTLTQERSDFQQFRCSGETVFAMMIKEGVSQLSVFDSAAKKLKTLPMEAVDFSVPIPFGDKIYLVGVLAKAPMRLLELNLEGKSTVIKKSSSSDVDERNVSDAVAISYPTEDGKKSYGYFSPPVNSNYKAPQNEKPPVRVLVHGGPIGMTSPGFQKQKLFWTSQGYAIFDVNYRGSVGFGRAYRDALKKKWGLLEIQDVKDGLAYLTKQGYISGQAVVSGGSAGGYSVQRLLTFYPDLFAAGASHFGIGNLVTLQKLTHKYESHFLEQLIGGTLKTNLKEYQDRSPINHLEKIKSPMIIFQGSDDKVVPPENSREMAAILEKKGVRHEYYEYPGEDHGFRKKENLVDSLQKEAAFFKSVLKPAAK